MLSRKLIKYPYNPKDRAAWLKLRAELQGYGNPNVTRIGGSDIGVVMNVDDYRSKIELFYRLLSPVPPMHEHNLYTYRGTWQEEHIKSDCWAYYNPQFPNNDEFLMNVNAGKKLRKAVRKNFTYINPEFPNIFINLDFQIVKSKLSPEGVLEIKSVSTKSADKYEAGVATSYIYQTISQMFTSGHKYAELFQLKDSTYPDLFIFQEDGETESIFNQVVTEVDSFVASVSEAKMHLANGMEGDEKEAMLAELEPDIVGGEHVEKFLNERFRSDFTTQIDIDLEGFDVDDKHLDMADYAKRYLELGKAKKEASKGQSLCKNELTNFMIHHQANVINFNGYGTVSKKGRFNVQPNLINL